MTEKVIKDTPERNDMALISMVIGVIGIIAAFIPPFLFLSLICGPVGLLGALLGFIALRQINRGHGTSSDRVRAVLGIILGVLPMLALCGMFFYYLSTGQIDQLALP